MRFKIDPEVVRLIAMIAAFVQIVGATLAANDVIPKAPVLVLVAIGAGLQGALIAYAQGVQTPTVPEKLPEGSTPATTVDLSR